MKHQFEKIAFAKKLDILFQCVSFIVTAIMVCYTDMRVFGLYIMGASQVLSAICWWLYFQNDIPQRGFDKWLTTLFAFGGILVCIASILFKGIFFYISLVLLILGPILGVTYFIVTVVEARFYSRARKPFYLL